MKVSTRVGVFIAGANFAFASLLPVGPVPISGTGLGALNTALTFSSPGSSTTESGCVAAGIGGVTVTGSAACPSGFTGGDEQAINNTYTASDLGLTDFNNLQIVFNASEPGSAEDITIDNLAVTLWNPADGLILDAKYITGPYVITDGPGVGNAGFGFMLDAAQAADFNLLLAAFPDLRIGVAANASDATGGLETISFRAVGGSTEIPEPPILMLIGAGLTFIGASRYRFRVKR